MGLTCTFDSLNIFAITFYRPMELTNFENIETELGRTFKNWVGKEHKAFESWPSNGTTQELHPRPALNLCNVI